MSSYVTLENLSRFKSNFTTVMNQAIATAEAQSLHTVEISGTHLKFYKEIVSEVTPSTSPAFDITLPSADLSGVIAKIQNATGGKIATTTSDGSVAESNVAIADLATATALTTLENSLSDVATSGDSADVSYSGTIGSTAVTNVDDALDALADIAAGDGASKRVYITETAGGSGDAYSKRYGIYQGATGSAAEPVVSEKITDIDIPKDMVVEEGSVVTITFDSTENKLYDGATDVTTLIKGSDTPTAADAGKYIRLIIANATSDRIYISVKTLVDLYTAAPNATQVQLAIDANNVISAVLVAGGVGTTELANSAVTTAKIADDAVTSAKILDGNVTMDKLSAEVQTAIGTGGSAIQSVVEGSTNGTLAVDGTDVSVHGLGTAAYTASTAYATSAQGALAATALQPGDITGLSDSDIDSLFASA